MLISVFICSTIALLLFDFCEQCKLHDDLDPEICDDTSDLCTDPGFQRWVCCNSSGYIPLPSALESCTFNRAAISCHRSLNIANKARVSIPQDRPGKLTDGDVGTYIEVKSNSTENWIVEFEAWVSVYSIVLLTYGDGNSYALLYNSSHSITRSFVPTLNREINADQTNFLKIHLTCVESRKFVWNSF